MATMLEKLRAKRENGEISTASASSVRITGEGHFTVEVVSAEWSKNRNGDAEQGKIGFKVIAVRKDTSDSEIGSVFSEYVSLKNEEMAERKYLQISDWMTAAGVKDDKLVNEDDDNLKDSMQTLIQALQKYCTKKQITADCYRKASDKTDSKGRPYYNVYFDDPFSPDGNEEDKKDAGKKTDSPYKGKKQASHDVDDED